MGGKYDFNKEYSISSATSYTSSQGYKSYFRKCVRGLRGFNYMSYHGNCETKITDTILTVTDISPGSGKGEMNPFINGIDLRLFPRNSYPIQSDIGDPSENSQEYRQ